MSSKQFDLIYQRMDDDTERIEEVTNEPSEIQNFYAGKTVFLTGATGFLGKAILEKLLRGCPDLKKIYVLVRNKRGLSAEQVITKLVDDVVFNNLKIRYPNFKEKIVLIKGDLAVDKLGISKNDREILINEVNVMIHNGATTKFDEAIRVALTINCLATKHMLDLAMECKNIASFLYISTAYSHCYKKNLEDKFYPPPAGLKVINQMIEVDTNTNGLSEEAVSMLLGKWANVYTFTKSVAEDLVREYGERAHFPCGVQRPSIVLGTVKEPVPGWLGNLNGPAMIFLGFGLGYVHCIPDQGHPMDFIPVDLTVNALIAATWDLTKRWEVEHKPVMYNYGSSTANPISLYEMYFPVVRELEYLGSKKMMWYPFMVFCRNNLVFLALHVIFHLIPSIFADLFLIAYGKKPRAFSIAWKATKHWKKIDYFANGNWRLHVDNSLKICDKLNATDKKLFDFDIRKLDWEDYSTTIVRGYRIFIMNESFDNVEQQSKRATKLRKIHYTVRNILYLTIAYILFNLMYSIIF